LGLPTAAAISLQQNSSSASTIIYIIKIFVACRQESSSLFKSSDRGTIHQAQRSHQLADYNSVEAKSTGWRFALITSTRLFGVRKRKGNLVDKIGDVRQRTIF
jgi:hypothetical protein